ncbi:MAG: histidine phosphatase family protein [Thermocrispum sp.]
MGAIYLVRHGQASFGAADYDKLSGLGAEQGAVVGEELRRRELRLAVVRSGSMVRQRDTALAAGFEPAQDARWNEYDFTDVLSHAEPPSSPVAGDPRAFQGVMDKALVAWVRAGDGEGRAAESWTAFAARVNAALDDLVADLGKGHDGLVFTSGGVIGAVAARLVGDQPGRFPAFNRIACNAGVTKIISGRSGLTLVAFSEHAHFEGARRHLLTFR